MRNKLVLAAVGAVALLGAGLAIAKGVQTRSVTAVSGTFTATTATGRSETRSCTTTDGKTLVSTHATFTGAADSGSPELAGTVTVVARSLVNTTDDVGTLDARVRIATSKGKTDLRFTGVYDHGNVSGLATGHAGTPHVRLVANLSSAFSTSGGFTNGKLGGGTAGGSAVEVAPGRCAPTRPAPKPRPESVQAKGTINAVSSTSITVAGITCAVPSSLAARVDGFKAGDRASIRCSVSGGTATLTKIDGKR